MTKLNTVFDGEARDPGNKKQLTVDMIIWLETRLVDLNMVRHLLFIFQVCCFQGEWELYFTDSENQDIALLTFLMVEILMAFESTHLMARLFTAPLLNLNVWVCNRKVGGEEEFAASLLLECCHGYRVSPFPCL